MVAGSLILIGLAATSFNMDIAKDLVAASALISLVWLACKGLSTYASWPEDDRRQIFGWLSPVMGLLVRLFRLSSKDADLLVSESSLSSDAFSRRRFLGFKSYPGDK